MTKLCMYVFICIYLDAFFSKHENTELARSSTDIFNYSQYQETAEPSVVDNLPPLPKLREIFEILDDPKFVFDQMETDGPTSHLGYLNFLALDIKLLRKQVGLDCKLAVSTTLAKDLRNAIGDKLWPYCGCPLAKAAAYLTDVKVQQVSGHPEEYKHTGFGCSKRQAC